MSSCFAWLISHRRDTDARLFGAVVQFLQELVGPLLEGLMDLPVGIEHRVAGLLHQRLLEGIVGDRVVHLSVQHHLEVLDVPAQDAPLDLLQGVESAGAALRAGRQNRHRSADESVML